MGIHSLVKSRHSFFFFFHTVDSFDNCFALEGNVTCTHKVSFGILCNILKLWTSNYQPWRWKEHPALTFEHFRKLQHLLPQLSHTVFSLYEAADEIGSPFSHTASHILAVLETRFRHISWNLAADGYYWIWQEIAEISGNYVTRRWEKKNTQEFNWG